MSDNQTWAQGLLGPAGLAINGSYLYVADYATLSDSGLSLGSTISKINLSDGSVATTNWATGLYGPFNLVIDGSYMYATNLGYGYSGSSFGTTISRINLSTGQVVDPSWVSGLTDPAGLVIDASNNMYVSNVGLGSISKINVATGSIIDANWATGLEGPFGLAIYGSDLYVATNAGTISQIDLSTGTIINLHWSTGFGSLTDIAIYGSYMYVIDLQNSSISQVSLADGSITNLNWITGFQSPFGIVIDNPYMYVSDLATGTIGQYSLNRSEPPVPESNICFPANTPVLTDQGVVAIDKINPDIHTIRGKSIVGISKTITKDTYLVCFEKDALGPNIPSDGTIMSRQHKVLYKGKCIEAHKFLGHFDKIYKVKYDGEILYNVLLEEYSAISVNNLICETLHPNNIIAKFFTRKNNYTEEERKNMVMYIQRRSSMKNIVYYK
jgi:hypothetical protein